MAYDYYKGNLRFVTWEEFLELRGNCNIRYDFTASELVENGLSGEIISDLDILKVVITITDESGSEIYSLTLQLWVLTLRQKISSRI